VDKFAELDIDAASLRNLCDAELRDELQVCSSHNDSRKLNVCVPFTGSLMFIRSAVQSIAVEYSRKFGCWQHMNCRRILPMKAFTVLGTTVRRPAAR